jgi:hypothetical protein
MPKRQFLFSAVFVSRKVLLQIFSESDETKAQYLIFHGVFQKTEEESKRASRGLSPHGGAAGPTAAPAYGEHASSLHRRCPFAYLFLRPRKP